MKAIIMAGGEGSRLRPLTCARPKPMVPIVNRPCMEHIVNLLRGQGIREIGVTLQYLPEEIQNYFGDWSRFRGQSSLLHRGYSFRHGGKREECRLLSGRDLYRDQRRCRYGLQPAGSSGFS